MKHLLFSLLALLCLTGCSLMETDREGCPEGLYVSLRYDYNALGADLFSAHVGQVRVLVYDLSGRLAAERTATGETLAEPWPIHFTPQELPAGRYRLVAICQSRTASPDTPGAKLRASSPQQLDGLRLTLDRQAPDAQGLASVPNQGRCLDTLWTSATAHTRCGADSRQAQTDANHWPEDGLEVEVKEADHCPTYATLTLMRQTKNLNITLRQTEDPNALSADDYAVYVTSTQGATLGPDGGLLPDEPLRFTPYQQWTTTATPPAAAPAARAGETAYLNTAAHYDLSLVRMMARPGLTLHIDRRLTGEPVAQMDLPSMLATDLPSAYGLMPRQEVLDREYDYRLSFVLVGNTWQYVDISINVMGWSVRRYNTSL